VIDSDAEMQIGSGRVNQYKSLLLCVFVFVFVMRGMVGGFDGGLTMGDEGLKLIGDDEVMRD